MQDNCLISPVISIGGRVKWARQQKKMTQATLAKAAGVATSNIGNLEAGIRGKPRELNAIAAALGVSSRWLEYNQGEWDDASAVSLTVVSDQSPSEALTRLVGAFADMDSDVRDTVADLVAGAIRRPEKAVGVGKAIDAISIPFRKTGT